MAAIVVRIAVVCASEQNKLNMGSFSNLRTLRNFSPRLRILKCAIPWKPRPEPLSAADRRWLFQGFHGAMPMSLSDARREAQASPLGELSHRETSDASCIRAVGDCRAEGECRVLGLRGFRELGGT